MPAIYVASQSTWIPNVNVLMVLGGAHNRYADENIIQGELTKFMSGP